MIIKKPYGIKKLTDKKKIYKNVHSLFFKRTVGKRHGDRTGVGSGIRSSGEGAGM